MSSSFVSCPHYKELKSPLCQHRSDCTYCPAELSQPVEADLANSSLATGLLWAVTSNSHRFLHLPPDFFLLLYLVCFQKPFSLVASPEKYSHVFLCLTLDSQMSHTMGVEWVTARAIVSGCACCLGLVRCQVNNSIQSWAIQEESNELVANGNQFIHLYHYIYIY